MRTTEDGGNRRPRDLWRLPMNHLFLSATSRIVDRPSLKAGTRRATCAFRQSAHKGLICKGAGNEEQLWIALLVFALCYAHILGARPTELLSTASLDATEVELAPLHSSIVRCQQLVTIQSHVPADGDATGMHLNPIDDAQTTAVPERKERSAAGGYAWYGRVEGTSAAAVLLAVARCGSASAY
jgi:hypothetical protein